MPPFEGLGLSSREGLGLSSKEGLVQVRVEAFLIFDRHAALWWVKGLGFRV
jgi:hypothetical protein